VRSSRKGSRTGKWKDILVRGGDSKVKGEMDFWKEGKNNEEKIDCAL
jgi:hypothetical protein